MSDTNSVEMVPKEQLERARRNLCSKIVAVLVQSMAETNTTCEQIDKRLGRPPGHTQNYVLSLMNFAPHQMKDLAYLAEAMGAEVDIGVQRVIPQRPLVNRHIPIEDIDQFVWLFRSREQWDQLDPYTLVEVMDGETTFHIGPKFSFNEDHVLRWKLCKPFETPEPVDKPKVEPEAYGEEETNSNTSPAIQPG